MDKCAIPNDDMNASFEEISNAMQTEKYWINFFVRPCCPPPSYEEAVSRLDKRRAEIEAREDFSDEQKAQLLAIVDERQQWYGSTPFSHKK